MQVIYWQKVNCLVFNRLKKRLESIEIVVTESVDEIETPQVAYSIVQASRTCFINIERNEEKQLVLAEYLKSQEISENPTRQKSYAFISISFIP